MKSHSRSMLGFNSTLAFIAVVFIFFGCRKEKASWNSVSNLPLLEDTLTLTQLLKDSLLVVQGGSSLALNLDETVYSIGLSDLVKVPDTTVEQNFVLDNITLSIPPGFSIVNDLKEHELEIGSVQLKKIIALGGLLQLKVSNPLPTKTFFKIELPGVTKNGVVLNKQFVAPAGTLENPGVVQVDIDIADYELDLRGSTGSFFNRIPSRLTVQSDPNGPSVTMTNKDVIGYAFNIKDVRLKYARGFLGNLSFSDTIVQKIKGLDAIESGYLDLESVLLDLSIKNGMKVAAQGKITHLVNKNKLGTTISLVHPSINKWITLNAATGNSSNLKPSETQLLFNSSTSNLEQFLENLGDELEVGYAVQMNPWGNTSGGWDEVFEQSKVELHIKGDLPLSFKMDQLILSDTFDFKPINNSTENGLYAKDGYIWLEFTNAFPINGLAEITLLDENSQSLGTVATNTPIKSSLQGKEEVGVKIARSRVRIPLSTEILEALPKVNQLKVKVKLNTPDDTGVTAVKVKIPSNAFLGVRAGAELSLKVQL